jgi:hypothetical protein
MTPNSAVSAAFWMAIGIREQEDHAERHAARLGAGLRSHTGADKYFVRLRSASMSRDQFRHDAAIANGIKFYPVT